MGSACEIFSLGWFFKTIVIFNLHMHVGIFYVVATYNHHVSHEPSSSHSNERSFKSWQRNAVEGFLAEQNIKNEEKWMRRKFPPKKLSTCSEPQGLIFTGFLASGRKNIELGILNVPDRVARARHLSWVVSMAYASKFLLLIALVAAAYNTDALKQKVTRIQFYMHDIVGGPEPTAVRVASRSNFTGQDPIAATFGSIVMMDNPLTVTPNINSTLVGRAQGMYAMSSQQKEFSLLMTLTYAFTSGPYNGSTFSVLGRNPVMNEVREMPVVGGTGKFRLARGYCLARSYSMKEMDAVIGYNVTLLH
ncbi:hypothetical protein POUND7_005801 [Theobroma cacao]